jgi:hypothetical protein
MVWLYIALLFGMAILGDYIGYVTFHSHGLGLILFLVGLCGTAALLTPKNR